MVTNTQQKSVFSRAQEFAKNHPFLTAGIAATTVAGTALTVVGLNASLNAWHVANNIQQTGCASKGLSDCVKGSSANKFSFAAKAGANAVKDIVTSAASSVHSVGSHAFTSAKENLSNGLNSAKEGITNGLNSAKEGITNGLSSVKEAVENKIDSIPTPSEVYSATTDYAHSAYISAQLEVGNVLYYVENTKVVKLAGKALSSIKSFIFARPMGEFSAHPINFCKK